MQTDATIRIEEVPILDREGNAYGMAYCTEVDLSFDGSDVIVERVRFLSEAPNGNPHVMFGPMLDLYCDYISQHYDSLLQDALIDWIESKSSRIADSRNRAMREAV